MSEYFLLMPWLVQIALTQVLSVGARPGYDLQDTPQSLLVWFDDSGQGGSSLGILLAIAFLVFIAVSRSVTRSSVQGTMLRAKKLGRNVARGGKIREKI